MRHALLAIVASAALCLPAQAQNAPTRAELEVYAGLHEAAAKGDVAEIEKLIAEGEKPNIQDSKSRTPLHVAAFMKKPAAVTAWRVDPSAFQGSSRKRLSRGGTVFTLK